MTPQILVEYVDCHLDNGTDTFPAYCTYKGIDGMIYYVPATQQGGGCPGAEKQSQKTSLFTKFQDISDYFHQGSIIEGDINAVQRGLASLEYSTSCVDGYYFDFNRWLGLQRVHPYIKWDKINIYFLRGFNLDGLDGITLKVHTTASVYYDDGRKDEGEVCMLDYFLSKEKYYELSKPMSSPMYMNSKFYDHYIQIQIPSILAIGADDYKRGEGENLFVNESFFAIKERDLEGIETENLVRYRISPHANIFIDFATVSSSVVNRDNGSITFALDPMDSTSFTSDANSDFFNIRIYEDEVREEGGNKRKCITYYPTYGDVDNAMDLTPAMMARIESGEIQFCGNAFFDLDKDYTLNDIDYGNVDSLYTDDSDAHPAKWQIYNDLDVVYRYKYLDRSERFDNVKYDIEESYSRIIDYESQSNVVVDFWRTRFIPVIREVNGMECDAIFLKYTCRLVNILSGVQLIRVASMVIHKEDIAKYKPTISDKTINTKTYKIINKITNNHVFAPKDGDAVISEKYIRSYCETTNLVCSFESGMTTYPQGQGTLHLRHTSSNYRINLKEVNSDNVAVPYDFTGPYRYKLVFPTVMGTTKTIFPLSDNPNTTDLSVGTMVFYISADVAKEVMKVPENERYFAIVIDTTGTMAQQSTVYEGKVSWY